MSIIPRFALGASFPILLGLKAVARRLYGYAEFGLQYLLWR